jgi:hypothetical protein
MVSFRPLSRSNRSSSMEVGSVWFTRTGRDTEGFLELRHNGILSGFKVADL